MKPSVYIETTIPSYLTAWTSRDLVMAARQQITREWWENRRHDFDLFVSELVLEEAAAGDAEAAARRMNVIRDLPVLTVTSAASRLAKRLIRNVPLPRRAAADAVHVAVASIHEINYLLTWNCKHLANIVYVPRIANICRHAGYEPALICMPDELMEGESDEAGSDR